jgi:hypothetical protein
VVDHKIVLGDLRPLCIDTAVEEVGAGHRQFVNRREHGTQTSRVDSVLDITSVLKRAVEHAGMPMFKELDRVHVI